MLPAIAATTSSRQTSQIGSSTIPWLTKMPRLNSSVSPGRKKPSSTAHSAKMIAIATHIAQFPAWFSSVSGSSHPGRTDDASTVESDELSTRRAYPTDPTHQGRPSRSSGGRQPDAEPDERRAHDGIQDTAYRRPSEDPTQRGHQVGQDAEPGECGRAGDPGQQQRRAVRRPIADELRHQGDEERRHFGVQQIAGQSLAERSP